MQENKEGITTISFLKKFRLDWKSAFFLIIILLGIFFRTYKFDQWITFGQDAFRDSMLVSRAYENGPSELPLLGPRAGGSELRLGPAFYYFQYLSAEIFSSVSAPVLAYPNLIFSILSLFIFYLLLSRYFSRDWSMVLSGLFSLSYLAIEYSRFTWNPNSAPFFNLLFFWSLLMFFDERYPKWRNCLIVLSALSFAISTQLHFSNFLGLPMILIAFLAFNWKKTRQIFRMKQIALFLLTILIIYSPVIFNELLDKWDNSKEFFAAVKNKNAKTPLVRNIVRDGRFFGKYFFRIITGTINPRIWQVIPGFLFILASVFTNLTLLKKEPDIKKKQFLNLTLLIFAVFFLLYIPLSKKIDNPRFFLPLFFLPLVFLGYIGTYLLENYKRYALARKTIFVVAIILITLSNLRWTLAWFSELKRSEKEIFDPKKTLVLKAKKTKAWWTWGQYLRTAEYMKRDCPEGKIYFMVGSKMDDLSHSFQYSFKALGMTPSPKLIRSGIYYDNDGCYFYISRPDSQSVPDKLEGMDMDDPHMLANISVTRFYIPEEKRIMKAPRSGDNTDEDTSRRLYWKDISRLFGN